MRWARCLLLAALWMLLAAWLMPVRAQAAQNNYYYPGYDAASNGDVDLMRYMKQITMTVNGQEYTSAELKELKDAGTPLQMKVGDTASFNFSFSLCGRAYDPNDPTSLDAGASTHATYTHGTTYLNGESVAAGQDGILDDSSLMVDNQSADSSFLRLDIGWLLDFCPEGISINYSEGGVSFRQRDRYLYIYFPNGIGQDTYADPGYFSIGVTVGETLDEIRIPGTDGFYVPGTDDWVFPVDRWTTGTEPHVITYKSESGVVLVAGHTYVLHEESAPDGYELAADITFVFNGDGTIPDHGYHTITMEDKPTPPPPTPTPPPATTPPGGTPPPQPTPPGETPPERVQTGDDPWMWVWLGLGVACLCGAAVTALFYYRRANIPAYWRLGMRDQ